ncbi:MAG: folate-binding protein [Alphaproteobacteria bacterium]|nr:folate-binding protein [Alphaproteobacteria bacterium]
MALYAPARSVLRVAGEDAGGFLDALVTNDVSRATPEAPVYAGLLSPQGKVIADFIAFRAEDGALLLDVDRSRGEDLLRRLALYRLRRKIELADVSERFHVLVHTDAQSGLTADPRRPDGSIGARVLETTAPANPDPIADYAALLIAAGVPDLSVDAASEEVFALEALFEEFNGVDFQKGCFIGQENVSRMKRRATTRRKFCRIAFEGPAPAFGTGIAAGPAQIGSVRSGVEGRAIALLRLDRAVEAADKNIALTAGGITVRLDPPAWLIMPEHGDD